MFCNIAGYKFIVLPEIELPRLRKELKAKAKTQEIKGTILISTEGINLFLAAKEESIKAFLAFLFEFDYFKSIEFKYSYSDFIPFQKLFVKIRKEIVTFKREEINPTRDQAPYITPEELRNFYEKQQDVFILDTRNTFEFEMGTFKDAQHLYIDNFREFPDAIKQLPEHIKHKPVVTFCTGGIRCEKAAVFLLENGFTHVYQLQGGILNYFEKCGGDYFNGNCFVFDDRIALNSKLQPTKE